jgi:hypothetical protein
VTRRIRIVTGVIVFVLSMALLIWGLKPLERIKRTQPIQPNDLRLPTPISLHIDTILVS